MRCTPGDPCGIHAPAGNLLLAMVVALPRLVIWHRPRSPRLRLLTGTRPQQAAMVLALRPVVREISPTLEAAGLEVCSIAILPTLTGSAGESLQAEVEQANGSNSFTIRLAHWVSGTLRRPEEVAGALAEELLGLYRDVAAVTIVRQTPAVVSAMVTADAVATRRNGRSGFAIPARSAVKDDAEGKVVQFRADPLGSSTNGHAG